MKLYIYQHCPYCVRVQMMIGLKNLSVQQCVLAANDQATPEKMIGKKMVPILQKSDGSYLAESMDIVHYLDQLDAAPILAQVSSVAISQWLADVRSYTGRLLMPRFVQGPFAEFTSQAARDDFIARKEAYIGSFAENIANSWQLIPQLEQDLLRLADLLAAVRPLSDDDIQLFPLLRNLTLVQGIHYPSVVADYRDSMAQRCRVNLLYPV